MRSVWLGLISAALATLAQSASAETITIATGSTGQELEVLNRELAAFTAKTGITVEVASTGQSPLGELGQYQRWLSAHDSTIDVYRTDIAWAPLLARNFVDLADAAAGIAATEIPALVKAETVNGELVALPYTADLGALYYRKDLLDKYHLTPPATWDDMANDAGIVMDGERKAGDAKMWGYVFPGGIGEDLTANALEWIASNGGGHIVEDDGTISIDNVRAILAVEVAEDWVGTISPPDVVNYSNADSRSAFVSGEAVFARDWHDLLTAADTIDSDIRGKIGVAELPLGEHGTQKAATLGGWSLAVSRYSRHQDAAMALVRFLGSADAQKTYEAEGLGHLPAILSLYDDPDIAKAEPTIATFKAILPDAVSRPVVQTGDAYTRVSLDFAQAMNSSLRKSAFAEDFIQGYRHDLEFMQKAGWKPTTPRGQTGDTAP